MGSEITASAGHPPSDVALLLYYRISVAFFDHLKIDYWLEFSSALAVQRGLNVSLHLAHQNASTFPRSNQTDSIRQEAVGGLGIIKCLHWLKPFLLPGELDVDFGFLDSDAGIVKAALGDNTLREISRAVALDLQSECNDSDDVWKALASSVEHYDSSERHRFTKLGLQGLGANCDWY